MPKQLTSEQRSSIQKSINLNRMNHNQKIGAFVDAYGKGKEYFESFVDSASLPQYIKKLPDILKGSGNDQFNTSRQDINNIMGGFARGERHHGFSQLTSAIKFASSNLSESSIKKKISPTGDSKATFKFDINNIPQQQQKKYPSNFDPTKLTSAGGQTIDRATGKAIPDNTPTTQQSGAVPGTVKNGQYTIMGGDTLSALALKHGTTVAELMKINPQISDPNMIIAGQGMSVPGIQPTMPDKRAASSASPAIGASGTAGATGATSGSTGATGSGDPLLDAFYNRLKGSADGQSDLRKKLATMIETQSNSAIQSRIDARNTQLDDLEEQIEDVPEEMRDRVKDFVVNATQLGRISAAEALPLSKLFTKVTRNVKALEVSLKANKEDQAAVIEAMKTRITAGEKKEAAARNVYNDYRNLLTTRKSMEKKLSSRDVKSSDGNTYREYYDSSDPTTVTHRVSLGKTYKSGGGGSTTLAGKETYFTRPDKDGTVKYYFGDKNKPTTAQEITSEEYWKGKSTSKGALVDDTKDFLDDNYIKTELFNKAAYQESKSWYKWDKSFDDWQKESLDAIKKHIKLYKDQGMSDQKILTELLKQMQ